MTRRTCRCEVDRSGDAAADWERLDEGRSSRYSGGGREFDGAAPRQLICDQCIGLAGSFRAIRGCHYTYNCKPQFVGGPLLARSIQSSFHRPYVGVIALNVPPIAFDNRINNRETGNDPRNQTGNDVAAKGAFPAWTGGGVWLHAIVGAGAVGGRSTGDYHARRRAPCGHRDPRDATAVRTTHHSP